VRRGEEHERAVLERFRADGRNCVGRFRGNVRGAGAGAAGRSARRHRHEDKPAWWRSFCLRTLSPAELTGEPDALGGLSGGEVVGQVKKSVVRRFRFLLKSRAARGDSRGSGWSV
jgi:hypothetical protein